MRQRLLVTLCSFALAASACDAGTGDAGGTGNLDQTCSPNFQQECPCGGGVMGIQSCTAEGTGWTACDCGDDTPACVPDCQARVCGDDGCNGFCGSCDPAEICSAGACKGTSLVGQPCDQNGDQLCDGVTDVVVCSGGSWIVSQACGTDEPCADAVCVYTCQPDCDGRVCGDDGCGDFCGSCPPGQGCDALAGQCVEGNDCFPNASKQCVETAVYWFNSCDEKGDWVETCQEGTFCSEGQCVEACTPHAAKRCKGDNVYWYDSCGEEESAFAACEDWEYCIHQGAVEAACLKGVYAGQWFVKANPSDAMFFDNTFTLTEDAEAKTVTFEELIPGFGTAYYTGTLSGKLLVATGTYDHGGATYDITIQITFTVPPDTNGVAPTAFTGFWSTDLTGLGAIVTNIVGDKL